MTKTSEFHRGFIDGAIALLFLSLILILSGCAAAPRNEPIVRNLPGTVIGAADEYVCR